MIVQSLISNTKLTLTAEEDSDVNKHQKGKFIYQIEIINTGKLNSLTSY